MRSVGVPFIDKPMATGVIVQQSAPFQCIFKLVVDGAVSWFKSAGETVVHKNTE